MRTAFNRVKPKDWPLSAHVFFSKCSMALNAWNSEREALAFRTGSRTVPITDLHLENSCPFDPDHEHSRSPTVISTIVWKGETNALGWGSDQSHISHLVNKLRILVRIFLRNCLLPPILILNCRRAGIVQSTILHLFNPLSDRNPFDREIDWNLYLPPLPRQSSSNLASRVWMLLQIASFFSHFAATFFDASARNFTRNGNCSGKACSLLI